MVGTPQLRSQLQQAQNIEENEMIRQGGKKLSIYMQQVILELSWRTVLYFKQIDPKVLGLSGS